MRAEALAAFPDLDVQAASLPDLAGVPDGTYANVLCNAVLIHLPAAELIGAAVALARILRPGGRLVLSYRGPRNGVEREPDGRLFTPIVPGRLVLLLESVGLAVIHREDNPTQPGPTSSGTPSSPSAAPSTWRGALGASRPSWLKTARLPPTSWR